VGFDPVQEAELTQLMRRANDGDGSAYEQLLMRILPFLRTFISRRLGRTNGGEDVVQEILLSVHKARHTFDTEKPFMPWMLAIAQYRLADHWRRNGKIAEREISDESLVNLAPADQTIDWNGGNGELEQVLSNLNGRQREVVTLLKVDGLSIKEAAQRLGMSESALKVTAHRAYKVLKESLESTEH